MRRLEGSDKSRAQLGSDVTLPHTTHAGPKVERYLAIKQPCPYLPSSHQNKVRGCHSKRKAATRHVLCLVRGSKCSPSKLGRRHVARLPFAQFQPPTQSERVFAVNCPVWGQVNDVPTAFGDRSPVAEADSSKTGVGISGRPVLAMVLARSWVGFV